MAIFSKGCKPDNFQLHNSLRFSFTNLSGLCSNFVDCESFFESNSPNIFALCETNLDNSVYSGNFSVRGYRSLIQKDPITHMQGLTVYVKKGSNILLMISIGFTSLSVILLLPQLITFFVFMHSF